MKLLFAHECFGAFGGAESNLFHTATELKRRGHSVAIVHGPSTGKGVEKWEQLFDERFPLNESETLTSAVRRFQPDSIYVHKLAEIQPLEEMLASRTPVVRMVHDHETYCLRGCRYGHLSRDICTRPLSAYCLFPCGGFIAKSNGGGLPVRLINYFQRKKEMEINRQFDRLIVATNYMKEELLLNEFDENKIEIHAPTPPRTEAVERKETKQTNLILFSGQIIRGKGVDVLLQALKQVKCDFQCLIFGDGGHRSYCESLCRELGLNDRVQFKGYVSQDELQKYYGQASVMVVSSVWPEPFGAVGLEGMHHALPVVAFDAGGIKEWLIDGYNGFLVPWMDTKEYAARVEELLINKPLAEKMGHCGKQLANEVFNFSNYVDGLESMFDRVIKHQKA
ncbi:MAG TPA: glycosyltransferase family 4 protein [Verrucomicrobiae bacterium]